MDQRKAYTEFSYEGGFQGKETEFYLLEYNKSSFSYKKVNIEDIPFENSDKHRWIQVLGLADVKSINSLAQKFGIHRLNIRAILNVTSRPELDRNEERLAVTFNFPRWPKGEPDFHQERTAVVRIKENSTIITFEENPKTLFTALIGSVEENLNEIRSLPIDKLLFLLLERILGKYFSTAILLSEKLRDYEASLTQIRLGVEVFSKLHFFKSKIRNLIDSLSPLKREVDKGLRLQVGESNEQAVVYTKVVSGHLDSLLDQLEQLEMKCSSAFELALSINDFKMNQVMKNLNIYATIFLPLTFIAGVYGMNFKKMPVLEMEYGYYFSLGMMVVVALVIIGWFKRKNWF